MIAALLESSRTGIRTACRFATSRRLTFDRTRAVLCLFFFWMAAGCATRIEIPTVSAAELEWARETIGTATSEQFELDQNTRYVEIQYEQYVKREGERTGQTFLSSDHPGLEQYKSESISYFTAAVGATPAQVARMSPRVLRALAEGSASREERMRLASAADSVESHQEVIAERLGVIGRRVAIAAGRPNLTIYFAPGVLNAFAPHGFNTDEILIGTELALFARSDGELACVIGHEIGHITEGHTEAGAWIDAGKTTLKVAVAVALAGAAGYSTGEALTPTQIQGAINLGEFTSFLVGDVPIRLSGWGRSQEDEADAIGTYYAFKAGYDPHSCVAFHARMVKRETVQGESQGVPWWRTHPLSLERFVRVWKIAGKIRDGTLIVAPLSD